MLKEKIFAFSTYLIQRGHIIIYLLNAQAWKIYYLDDLIRASVNRLLDMASKSLLAKTGFDQTIRSLAYSPDGAHLAVGHGDGSFRILKGR